MEKKNKAYVDTSAFIAFLDKSDNYHPVFLKVFEDPPKLVTSPLVIAEGHGWFLKKYDPNLAFQFLTFIQELRCLEILTISRKDLFDSYKLIKKFSDQEVSLTDAIGLFIMEKLKIQSCWSTDFHLGLTGKTLIIHSYDSL